MIRAKYDRKVLLAVRAGHIDPRLLVSARNLSLRMEAGLDILMLTESDAVPAELDAFVRTLRDDGVAYSIATKPLLRRRDIVQYANTHECIVSVVIDSLEGWESVAADRASNPWAKLACPLVTAAVPKNTKVA